MWCVYMGGRGCSFGYRSYSVVPKEGRGKGVGLGPCLPPSLIWPFSLFLPGPPCLQGGASLIPYQGLVGSSSLILTLSPTPAPLAKRRSKELGAIGRSMEDSLLPQGPPTPTQDQGEAHQHQPHPGTFALGPGLLLRARLGKPKLPSHQEPPSPSTRRVGRALRHVHSSRSKTTDIQQQCTEEKHAWKKTLSSVHSASALRWDQGFLYFRVFSEFFIPNTC